MKTLLQINTVVNSGSTGRIAEEIGQKAIINGWRSVIAYGRNERPSKSELIKIGTDWDLKLHGIKTRLFDRHGFGSKRATMKLIKQIENLNPDIIHLHNIHGYYINIEILFEYLIASEIPVVWTLHDCWALTGHCAHFEFIGCKKWKSVCVSCPQRTSYPATLLFSRAKRNYLQKKHLFKGIENLTLVCVSDWLKTIVNKSFLSDKTTKMIHNGINLDVFKPFAEIKKEVTTQNEFIILVVMNGFSKKKGILDVFILSKLLDQEMQIVIVGLSELEIRKLPPSVNGICRTENTRQLAEWYSKADVFINPTYEDNFPTTNLEALACGTPVITYKTGGSIEAVSDCTGMIVEQGNIEELLIAIKTIKTKGKSHYSAACRARAIELYNKEDRYNEYIELYKSLLLDKQKKDKNEK